MPIVTTNFIRGRMNKSVDERLLPPGEYVDAMNLRLGSTETTEVGAVENSKGNTQLTTLSFSGQNLSTQATCIGAYQDSANETLYWFVHDPVFACGGKVNKLDLILSYNTNANTLRYHVISFTVLNFDPLNLITGIEKIEDLLFFSDNVNPPRKINIKHSYDFPVACVDQIVDEDINVIVKPPGYEFTPGVTPTADIPLPAPTFVGLSLPGSENYIEDRFLCFAYRYRYSNNEYSAISLFSKPAFATSPFKFSVKNYNNEGMQNRFNAVNVSFSTGSERVNEVDLLFKDTNTNSIYVIERFNKLENGWADDSVHTFQFNNSKIYSVLGSDELLRLYDNVPRKAQALTIMGNRLIYGNYVDGYNITNENDQKIAINYATELLTKNVDFVAIADPTITNGNNYTIDPNNTVTATNAVLNMNLSEIAGSLKTNSVISINLRLETSEIGGSTGQACFQDNINFGQGSINFDFSITLSQDYASVYDFSQSADFRNAIGTQEGVNFQPMATASQGGSLTDKFNNDLALPSITCTFTKVISGIDSSTAQQGFRITGTPGSDIIKLQTLAMKFNSAAGAPNTPATDLYEYFRVVSGDIVFSSASDTGSLHSNRDFATGIVYLDEYGRASTVLTSNFNTISIPTANSITLNKIKATVQNYAPSWAQRYKFVVKPSKGNYETIFSNFYYTVQTSQVTYFKLEGDNQNKVKTGDTLIVKTDVNGPISQVVKAKVLNVEAQARDFLNNAQGMGVDTVQLPGLYMEIKPSGFNTNIPNDAIIDNGELDDTSTGDDGRCKTGINYPLFTSDAGPPASTNNYTIPAGSIIDIKIRVNRSARGNQCEGFEWKWEQSLISSSEYPDFRRWWIGDQVNAANASPGKIQADGNIDVVFKTAVGSYSQGVPGVTCTDNGGQAMGDDSIFFQFVQDTPGDAASPLGLVVKTKKPGCAGAQPFSRRRNVSVKCEIVVTRANTMIVFETEPVDASPDIFFDASESYPILRDSTTGNYLHQAATADGDQNQTTSQPAIVTLPFIDCFTFGNGVESFKIKDDLAGRALSMGQRALAVSEQDFKEAHRFADLTYSGIFSSNAGVNNLNEFNLGLANFKELETSFGPIQKLYARETDILTLQEDKISYVLASKNLISDATGGGAIVSSPTILGTQIARTEEYGISFNPESFAVYGDSYYFTDTKRVAVIRLIGRSQSDQLEVISDKGMRSWFRDEFQLALGTQKLGGYDPYMDEYVLSTNDKLVPVPPIVYECGSEFQASSDAAQSYTIEFGTIIGSIEVDYVITGTGTISIVWDGNSASSGLVSNASGTVTINKTTNTPTTAVVTVTPSGNASWTITPKCVPPVNLTIFKCVINSNIDSGELIHVEYGWSDSQTISPIDTDQITMGSSSTVFSYFQSQTGVRSVGVYPYNGASLNMRINKLATDSYDFKFPNDNFKFLSTNTLYANTVSDVATLIGLASTIPNASVTNPTGTNIREATVTPSTTPAFTLPLNQQYLYLIYDFRFTAAQNLCFSDTSASEACCDCVIPCNSFEASTVQTSSTIACNQPTSQTFYYAGSGDLALYDLVYSDAACAGNAPGQGVNNLPAGYYKIKGNEYIRVNSLGMVIEKTSC